MRNWKNVALGVGGVVFALIGLMGSAGLSDEGKPTRGDAAVALRSARLYIQQHLWDKAQEQLQIAVKGDPSSAEAHFLLGSIYADRDSVEQMNRHFDLAMKLKAKKYGKDIQARRDRVWTQHYNSGVRAIQKERLEDALKEFSLAVQVDSTRADGYKSLGLAYLRLDRTEQGIEAYEKALAMDPRDKNAHVNLGIAYHNAGRPEKEVGAFEAAARLDPKSADVMSKLVMGYESLAAATEDSARAAALYDSAMSACERALALDPKNAKVAVTAGRLHLNRAIHLATTATREDAMPFYEKAEGYLKTAVELNPKDGPSMFNLGLCYSHQEKFDEAVGVFRKAVALDPKDVDSWAQIGLIQVRQKDLDGAIETFREVTAIQPDHVRAWELLASLYAQKDMVKKAREADATAQALKDQAEN